MSVTVTRPRGWLAGLLLLGLASQVAQGAEFRVVEGDVQLREGVYYLDATIRYELSATAAEALDSGVPLVVELRIEVVEPRRFWWDSVHAALSQRYRLSFHALSERFVLTNLNTRESTTFRSVDGMLRALGTVADLPVIDRALLDPERSYLLRLRASLDLDSLPGPLRPMAYISPSWRLASDWHTWRIGS